MFLRVLCEVFAELKTTHNKLFEKTGPSAEGRNLGRNSKKKLANTKKLNYCQQIDMFNL